MRKIIGLTGPTGSGKSSVREIGEKLGFKVIDCDLVSRKATEKNSDGLKALVAAFGQDILLADGALNRGLLAKKAFESEEKTDLLNKTILPFIVELVKKEIGEGDYIIDAPTLFESGLDGICDKTVAVLADSEKRLKRIIERDGLTIKDALIRTNAEKNDGFYIGRADYVVYNNDKEKEFKENIKTIIKTIKEED